MRLFRGRTEDYITVGQVLSSPIFQGAGRGIGGATAAITPVRLVRARPRSERMIWSETPDSNWDCLPPKQAR